jgi:hypothetical protein
MAALEDSQKTPRYARSRATSAIRDVPLFEATVQAKIAKTEALSVAALPVCVINSLVE